MSTPRVSILIPAYNERFFGEALSSALAQTYRETEVIVCDDSPGGAIEAAARAAGDARVRYVRNPVRLGFAANFTRCLELAQGDLVKFLNDDDRLLPECVERLAAVLRAQPSVALATSRRRVIDAAGREQPDVLATQPVAQVSALLAGRDLGNFALVNSANFIGEPTTVMFRRAAVALEGGLLFRWGGHDYHCLADLSLWLRLMANHLVHYAAAPLSEFRRHEGQEQDRGEIAVGCVVERFRLVQQALGVGYLSHPAQHAAALDAVAARARAWQVSDGPTDGDREVLHALLREIEAARPR